MFPWRRRWLAKHASRFLLQDLSLSALNIHPLIYSLIEVISKDLSLTEIDLLLIFQATFTDSSLVVTLAENVKGSFIPVGNP